MPTTAGTEPADVRVELNTVLEDAEITSLLDRVERDIDREYDASSGVTFDDTQHRVDFEAVLTALRIAGGRDRRGSVASSGRSRTDYEVDEIVSLRKRVRRIDPGDAFGRSGKVVRDTGRHISSTTDS